MNMHSADARTVEEALATQEAAQEKFDSETATQVAGPPETAAEAEPKMRQRRRRKNAA